MKEYLEIFDENNKPLNEKKERKIVHEKGLWHREIAVWIMNDENEVLIQKRAATKKLGANKWDLCCGHVEYGETLIEGALREAKEEVGIKNAGPSDLHLFDIQKSSNVTNDIINNHYKYCYILKTNLKIDDFVIQEEELSEVKYVPLEKLKNLSKEEKENFTGKFSNSSFKNTVEKLEEKLKAIEEE